MCIKLIYIYYNEQRRIAIEAKIRYENDKMQKIIFNSIIAISDAYNVYQEYRINFYNNNVYEDPEPIKNY